MTAQACGLCGKDPAEGFAMLGDVRYCHGDWTPDPTCYMRAQRPASFPAVRRALGPGTHSTENTPGEGTF